MNAGCSLFSGCGGDCVGMKTAGVDVKYYVELSERFCETHDANFDSCERIGNDIKQIPDEKFAALRGRLKVLVAGFPCQSFSNGGKKDANDSRGQLFREFVRATRLSQPEYIIGENVKGLLTRKTSEGELFIDVIIEEFRKIGYECAHKVLRADDYGVPQKRERLIIIGKRGDVDAVLKFPESTDEKKNLESIVKFDMTGACKVPDDMFEKLGVPEECVLKGTRRMSGSEPHPYLNRLIRQETVEWKGKKFEYPFSFGKRDSPIHAEIIDIRKPCKTIICTYARQPRLFIPMRNYRNESYLRCLLPDELKQIQGFPKEYKLCGTVTEQIIQIGNAIPPPLITNVCDTLLA
jgi:DNA (cytosine-5)-methyltransferase 1